MEAEWNLISSVGCPSFTRPVHLLHTNCAYRICLERLGVVLETDYKALVLQVFWRCVVCRYSPLQNARPKWIIGTFKSCASSNRLTG